MRPSPIILPGMPDGRIPPWSAEAEGGVLGTLLLGDIHQSVVGDILERPDMFYSGSHHHIYEAIQSLVAENLAVDAVAVSHKLVEAGKMSMVMDGKGYLGELLAYSTTSEKTLRAYAQVVRDKWILRELAKQAGLIYHQCYEPVESVHKFVTSSHAVIDELARATSSDAAYTRTSDLAKEMIRDLVSTTSRPSGIPTGFRDLDKFIVGLRRKKTYVIAARTSVGKSSLASRVAFNIANLEDPDCEHAVLYVTLEMLGSDFVQNMACAMARVDSYKISTKTTSPDEVSRIVEATRKIAFAPVYFADTPSQTMLNIKSAATRLVANLARSRKPGERPIRLAAIFIDHLGLVKPSVEASAKRSREQEVAETSRATRHIAEALNCSVVSLVQINREFAKQGTDGMPQLHHLKASGSIEDDADVVAILHRPRDKDGMFVNQPYAQLSIAKNRQGPIGLIKLKCEPQFATFSDWLDDEPGRVYVPDEYV